MGFMFTDSVEAEIRRVIAIQCSSQSAGTDHQASLYFAYGLAYAKVQDGMRLPELDFILDLAYAIEPRCSGRVRDENFTFPDGTKAAHYMSVDHELGTLFHHARTFQGASEWEVQYWVKQFLDIHPLTDGNGRTAWLLYNWMRNSWEDPAVLPDFYRSES